MTSPIQSFRIRSIASRILSIRTVAGGKRSPKICSFRFSPEPIPRANRPSMRVVLVSAIWVTIPGWYLTVGQVTPVVTFTRSVTATIPTSTV